MIQRPCGCVARLVLDSRLEMTFFRQYLSRLMCIWLLCQMVALAAPVVLVAAGATPVDELCTCPGGDHETCPMHHGGQPDTKDPDQTGVGACHAPLHVALLWMAGGAGVLPNPIALERPNLSAPLSLPGVSSDEVVSPHNTPPPRFQ